MNRLINILWVATAALALYNEAREAGLIDKVRTAFCTDKEEGPANAEATC